MSSSPLAAGLFAFSAAIALHPYEAVEPHMGTLFRVKLYALDAAQAESAFRAVFNRIAELDNRLSDYKPDSELNRVCRTAVQHPVRASPDLFRVLRVSEELSRDSNGAFDVTVGPLTRLWRDARKANRMPARQAIEAAKLHCGFEKMRLNEADHTVELEEEGMGLDLGGIAKGYAADESLAVLSKMGIHSALVAASGDLAFSDAPPGEIGWKIGVDSYDRAEKPFARVLSLANTAVSTSGSTEQHLDINGIRYSHILDPATGEGIVNNITVTVIARRGIEADATATAISVLGAQRGKEFVSRHRDLAALVVTQEKGHSRVWQSSDFPQGLVKTNGTYSR